MNQHSLPSNTFHFRRRPTFQYRHKARKLRYIRSIQKKRGTKAVVVPSPSWCHWTPRLSRSSLPHLCGEMLCRGRIELGAETTKYKNSLYVCSAYSLVLSGSVLCNLGGFEFWYTVHESISIYTCDGLFWLTAVFAIAKFQVQFKGSQPSRPSRQEMSMPALTGYSELKMLVCR